ncbi:MAG: O-antigen ligase family protein [Verrucomicrobiaceae bacterium]|nr:MAG: O-antigen ligase family protein [Verrucomicrobiaceae bacterium]
MNRLSNWALGLCAAFFVIIAATGIDLITSRIGVGLVGLGVALCVVSILRLVNPPQSSRPWLTIFSLLGAGYLVGRALMGGPEGLAVHDVALVLSAIGIYLSVTSTGRGVRGFWIILLAILVAVNVGLAISQSVLENPFYFWQPGGSDESHAIGLFAHYNAFASFLNGTVFFFLSYTFFGRNVAARWACALLSLGLIVTLVMSQSRGGWLSFVVGGSLWMVLLILFLKQRRSKLLGIISIAVVLLGVGGIVSSVWVVQRITEKRVEKYEENTGRKVEAKVSDGGRVAFQQMGFEIFLDSPVVGGGARAFSYRALEKWDPDTLELWMGDPEFAHNEFIQLLSDYGLVGFVLVLVLLFIHGILGVINLVSEDDRDSGLSIWQLGAAGGLVAMLCQSYFSFIFHFPACVVLCAFQLAILASQSKEKPKNRPVFRFTELVIGIGGLGVAAALAFLGINFFKGYLLSKEAVQKLTAAESVEDVFTGLETLEKAGDRSWDPKSFEIVARRAMLEANTALQGNDPAVAEKFNLRAKAAFERSLELNPNFSAALAGLPRVEDALGNHAAAEEGHQKAMKLIWAREIKLRPYFHAARSSFLQALKSDNDAIALDLLREAKSRILRRREILEPRRELDEEKEIRGIIQAWLNYYEGRAIFQRGNDIWINAKPRNPELALAFLLEAQTRYQLSEKLVKGKDPRWEREAKQLKFSVETLEAAQYQPVKLSEEQIGNAIEKEAVLDSNPTTR